MRWAEPSLGEVCEITMGQAPDGSSYNNQGLGYPLIAGAGDFGDSGCPTTKRHTSEPTKLCREGDIVLSIRATIGTKVLSDGDYCLGRGVAGLRATAKLDDRYLWHWLTRAKPVLSSKGRGATFPQISRVDIAELAIPLPPLDEQRRIAAILDKADALRQQRRRALGLLDGLTHAIFFKMFGDPITNSFGLATAKIGDICDVVTGNTPSRARAAFYGTAVEWIKSDNIRPPERFLSVAAELLSVEGRSVARLAPPGSTLVTCIAGSPNSIGNCAMSDREVAFNQQINALMPRDLNPLFLYAQLRVGKRLVQDASTGGMKGLVSKSRLQDVTLLAPPRPLQDEFAERAQRALDLADQLRVTTENDTLFASLQHRAFSGQL